MTVTLAWHGDPALKAEVAARMRKHREEDEIVKGLYQKISTKLASGYKGCLIGCTLPAQPVASYREFQSGTVHGVDPIIPDVGWHARVEELYGIPSPVGNLLDRIFENLPIQGNQHAEFAVTSIDAIPVGADLSMVPSRLMLDILADPIKGMHRIRSEAEQRAVVEAIITLFTRRLAGDEPSLNEWLDAYRTAVDTEDLDFACYAIDAANRVRSAEAPANAVDEAGEVQCDAAYARGDTSCDWFSWAAGRLLHHLANAPIPAKA